SVGPSNTDTVPSSPVYQGGMLYSEPPTEPRVRVSPLPSDPVSRSRMIGLSRVDPGWSAEPAEPRGPRASDPTESDDPAESDDPSGPDAPSDARESDEPSEPSAIAAPVWFSSSEPKFPNMLLHGPACAAGAVTTVPAAAR